MNSNASPPASGGSQFPPSGGAVIDAAHLERQRAWSLTTFGPGSRLLGVLDHIRKELKEIEDDPTDVGEWVDVIILAFDGAWRAGWEPQQIIDAIEAKQTRNEGRSWPDWRTMSADEAIEHVRDFTVGDTVRVRKGYRTPAGNEPLIARTVVTVVEIVEEHPNPGRNTDSAEGGPFVRVTPILNGWESCLWSASRFVEAHRD